MIHGGRLVANSSARFMGVRCPHEENVLTLCPLVRSSSRSLACHGAQSQRGYRKSNA
jgi:hypothetical protein